MKGSPTIGSLSEQIVLQEAISARTSSGSVEKVWSTLATVMANVSFSSVDETDVDNRAMGTDVLMFTIRSISSTSLRLRRIVWNGSTYNVKGVIQVNRRYQTIKAKLAE